MADAPFQKWLFRECCSTVVEVNKKYKDLEQFACKCGKKVLGEKLKYFDKKADAEAAKAKKSGGMDEQLDLSQL